MSRSNAGAVLGFRYYLSILMGLCRGPVNEIVEARAGDRTTTLREGPGGAHNQFAIVGYDGSGQPIWGTNGTAAAQIVPGSANAITDTQQVFVDSYELFGGERKEGGIIGLLDFFFGGPSQAVPSTISTRIGGDGNMSMLRGVVTAFFDGMVAGVNPYPKTWEFRVRRTTEGWDGTVFDPDNAMILLYGTPDSNHPDTPSEIHAMNGVHIVYEALTNRVWGRGLPRNRLDDTSWLAASQTLVSEGFGLCLRWTRTSEVQSFASEVLETIAANTYQDRSTGKIVIKLIRADYLPAELPLFDSESGLLDISEAKYGAPAESINEVIVTWRDPITGDERKARAQNLAAIQNAGGVINSTTREYMGIPTADLAARVAERELRLLSIPVRRFTMTLDRRGWQVYPGSVIRIRDLRRNLPEMVVRVANVREGGLKNGRIEIVAVQDVFSMPATASQGNQGNGWTPPNSTPCLGRARAIEMPYFMLARRLSTAELNAMDSSSARLATIVEEGQTLNTSYGIAVRNSAPTLDDDPVDNSYYCGYTPAPAPAPAPAPPAPPAPSAPTAMTATFTYTVYVSSRGAPYFYAPAGGNVEDVEISVEGTTVYTLTGNSSGVTTPASPQTWDYVVHSTRAIAGNTNDDIIAEVTGATPGAGVVETGGPVYFNISTTPQNGMSISYAGSGGSGTKTATLVSTTPTALTGLRVPNHILDMSGTILTFNFTLA